MRAPIAQIVLVALVLVSAVPFSVLVEPGYWQDQGVDGELMLRTFGNPGRNTAMAVWILCYAGLGLAVLTTGIVSFFVRRPARAWLPYAQTVLGILVVASLIVFILWIEPDWAPYSRLSDYTGNPVVMTHDPGWVAKQLIWKAAGILVGLAVAGLGVMQLRRYRWTQMKRTGYPISSKNCSTEDLR